MVRMLRVRNHFQLRVLLENAVQKQSARIRWPALWGFAAG